MDYLKEAHDNFYKIDSIFSKYATKSGEAIRFKQSIDDMRTPFFRDVDRMIHAYSYTRYADKTQVFSYNDNDHVSKRMIHVQLVSKIARTIGRSLNLNTDLIEAIALGHDIGHTPLGHTGESFLNEISLNELGEFFAHNIQSVRHYMYVENKGKGLNLTIQVLDGIMCHNGEILSPTYKPMSKTKEEFLREYNEAYHDLSKTKKYSPMTLEGCVVRISDIIGYIGRDIEDAISIGKLKRSDIPEDIIEVLGDNNSDIINNIVLDIIKNSLNKPYIKLSDKIYNAIIKLKAFNYEHIYNKSLTSKEKKYYNNGMKKIYKYYLNDIENKNKNSIIYKLFINNKCEEYLNNTSNKRIVIDFIAGMTDDLFLNEIKRIGDIK
ncbi:MAG: HD domain-containing protein [Bacilli bacterium]|nr:HD domain-containing protein [Bacilli bacterium]